MRQAAQHLARDHLPEAVLLLRPVYQYLLREARLGLAPVLADQIAQQGLPVLGLDALVYDTVGIDALRQPVVDVIDEGHAARHARREIRPDRRSEEHTSELQSLMR